MKRIAWKRRVGETRPVRGNRGESWRSRAKMVMENGRAMHEKDFFRYGAHFERTWSIWLLFFSPHDTCL